MEQDHRQKLVLAENNPYTPAQQKIIKLIMRGVTDAKTIATNLGISISTVKNEVFGTIESDEKIPNDSILGIYGVTEKYLGRRPHCRAELIVFLIESGIVKVEPS